MTRLTRMIAVAALVLAGTALATPQASAHGWHRHQHHSQWSRAPLFGWGHHCYLHRFVTYYGALAYRQVCY